MRALLVVVRRLITDMSPPPVFGLVEDILPGMGEDGSDLIAVTWKGQPDPVHAARHAAYADPEPGDVVHLTFVERVPVAVGAVVAFPPA
jgi:hypothetical protein